MEGIAAKAERSRNWWLSWYNVGDLSTFELHRPWWVSGSRISDDAETIVAAIRAPTEMDAKQIIERSYDSHPGQLEWRFCEERPDGWSPFTDRFPRGNWMRW